MEPLTALVRRLARPAPTRPWWRRHPRVVLSAASVLLGLAIITGALVTSAPPANALICDDSQSLPTIEGSAERAQLSVAEVRRDGHLYVRGTFQGQDHYPAGQGLTFTAFGFDGCGDTIPAGRLGFAELVWQAMLQPLKLVATAVDWALGGHLAGALLGVVGTVTAGLQSLVAQWLPAVITLILLVTILKVSRGRGQAFGQVAWMVAVIAGTSIVASPVGTQLATNLNSYAGGIARCAALAPTGAECDDASITSVFVDQLVAGTWSQGVLGDLGDDPIPATLQWHTGGNPDVNQDRDIAVPRDVIPAAIPGEPTWAEAWRWTGSYTRAESSYLASHGAAQCSVSQPTTGDITSTNADEHVPGDELCAAKYELRTAILSTLHETNREVYEIVRGMSSRPLDAAWSLAWLIPGLAILAFLAAAALVAEVKLLLYLALTPIAGVLTLRDAEVAKLWGGKILATFWARILAGVTFGVGVFLIATVIGLVNGLIAGGPDIPVALRPAVIGLLAVVVGVAAFAMRRELSELLGRVTGNQAIVAHADGGTEKLKQGLTSVAGVAVGAAAGGVGAGKGNVLMGMVRGGTRGAMSRGPVSAGFLGGEAGVQLKRGKELAQERAEDRALRRAQLDAPVANLGAPGGSGISPERQATEQALRGLLDAPEIRAAQLRAIEAAEALADAAREAAAVSERELRTREASVEFDVRQGLLTPQAAEAQLVPVRAQHEENVMDLVRAEANLGAAATELPDLGQQYAEAIRRGATATQLVRDRDASPELVSALTDYEQAIRLEQRLFYRD